MSFRASSYAPCLTLPSSELKGKASLSYQREYVERSVLPHRFPKKELSFLLLSFSFDSSLVCAHFIAPLRPTLTTILSSSRDQFRIKPRRPPKVFTLATQNADQVQNGRNGINRDKIKARLKDIQRAREPSFLSVKKKEENQTKTTTGSEK